MEMDDTVFQSAFFGIFHTSFAFMSLYLSRGKASGACSMHLVPESKMPGTLPYRALCTFRWRASARIFTSLYLWRTIIAIYLYCCKAYHTAYESTI